MKIYTRTGDTGSTGLFGGPRVSKDDQRIEAYGTVDELNAALGVARAADVGTTMDEQLQQIQNELFAIGAELASPEPEKFELRVIGDAHVQCLESWIDQHEQRVPPLTEFILPAGTNAAAQLHVSRGLCRRAERRVVSLIREQSADVSDSVLIYLNRLSDLLFVMSRVVNHDAGVQEVRWEKP